MRFLSQKKSCYLALLISLALWLYCAVYLNYCKSITPDSVGQLNSVANHALTDWKPVLLSLFYFHVQPLNHAGQAFSAAYLFQMACLAVGFYSFIIYLMKTRSNAYAWMGFASLLMLSKFTHLTDIGNDALGAGFAMCSISVFLWSFEARKRTVQAVLLVLAIVSLYFFFHLRLNAIFCVTFLFFFAFYRVFPRMGVCKKMLLAIICCISFQLFNTGVNRWMGATKSYPLNQPMISDLVNLSTLTKEWSPYIIAANPQKMADMQNRDEWMPFVDFISNNFDVVYPYRRTTDATFHAEIKGAWKSKVFQHPVDYAIMKVFFFHSSLIAGRQLAIFTAMMEARYPHIQIPLKSVNGRLRNYISVSFLGMGLLPLLSYLLIPIAFLWAYRKNRDSIYVEQLKLPFAITCSTLMYVVTYLPFTTACTEFRFYAPQTSLACLALVSSGPVFVHWLLSLTGRVDSIVNENPLDLSEKA